MLILTRKLNEEIIINSDIAVKILSVGDNQIKIGISAPDEVKILRGEIYSRIKEQSIEAVNQKNNLAKDFAGFKINKLKESASW